MPHVSLYTHITPSEQPHSHESSARGTVEGSVVPLHCRKRHFRRQPNQFLEQGSLRARIHNAGTGGKMHIETKHGTKLEGLICNCMPESEDSLCMWVDGETVCAGMVFRLI